MPSAAQQIIKTPIKTTPRFMAGPAQVHPTCASRSAPVHKRGSDGGPVQSTAATAPSPRSPAPALGGEGLPQLPGTGSCSHLSSHNRLKVPNVPARDCFASRHLSWVTALHLRFTSPSENLKIDGWNQSYCDFSDHYQELA